MSINEEDVKKIQEQLREIKESVNNVNIGDTAFPIWTDTVDGSERVSISGGRAGSDMELRADSARNAIASVLGWRVNLEDPNGFASALRKAFKLEDDDLGNKVVKWVRPSYDVQALETGVGKITGAQASIYTQARMIVEDVVLPRLDALEVLDDNADTQDIDAIRALIRPELVELVDQFGTEGGPLPQRVDTIFKLLLQYDPAQKEPKLADPNLVGGQLGLLRERFGLKYEKVNTVEEEERLTNYFIIVNSISTLMLNWHAQRDFFDRKGRDVFFGTQLVLLQRAMSVVAESLRELYLAMDSVFLGPSERQVMRLSTDPPITLAELLSWIEEIVSKKGFEIIRRGGKDGVVYAFVPILRALSHLLADVVASSQSRPQPPVRQRPLPPTKGMAASSVAQKKYVRSRHHKPPLAFLSQRVQVALNGLNTNLRETLRIARQIARMPDPLIEFIQPASVGHDVVSVDLTIFGADFQPGLMVKLTREDEAPIVGEVINVTSTQIIANFDLADAEAGDWNVRVVNPDGGDDRLEDAFTIGVAEEEEDDDDTGPEEPGAPDPSIKSITPNSSRATASSLDIAITGADFQRGAQVSMVNKNITLAGTVKSVTPTRIETNFDLTNVREGKWSVLVVNPDGGHGRLDNAFTITPLDLPALEIESVSKLESSGGDDDLRAKTYKRGNEYLIAIKGKNFERLANENDAIIVNCGGLILVPDTATILSDTEVKVRIYISSTAKDGPFSVSVSRRSDRKAVAKDNAIIVKG